MSNGEKRNIYTERHFDNDLREDRGKMSAEEQRELDEMLAERRAKADVILQRQRDEASAPKPKGTK